MTTKTDENSAAFAIDPRRFQGSKEAPFLKDSYPEERQQLTAIVICDLREHPPAERHPRTGALLVNPDPTWHRVRSQPVRVDGLTVDQLLSRNGGNPYSELRWLISWLLEARERRQELLKQIEQLELVERAFGAPVEALARDRAIADHATLDRIAAAGGAR